MNWLTRIIHPAAIQKPIEIPYVQCDVVLGNGAYIAHNHIFVNPDPKSFLAGILIACDSDPNISVELLSRPHQNRILSRFMCDNGLSDPRNFPMPYTGGYPEIPVALEALGVRYECFHPMDSFCLHEAIPGRSSFYAGSLTDLRVQEKTIDKMRGLLAAISSTDLVSSNINIRAAMIDKMKEVLKGEPYLAIGGKMLLGYDGDNAPEGSGSRPAFKPAVSHDKKTFP